MEGSGQDKNTFVRLFFYSIWKKIYKLRNVEKLISNVHEFEKMEMEVKEWLIINQLKAKFQKNVFLLCEIWKEIYAAFS